MMFATARDTAGIRHSHFHRVELFAGAGRVINITNPGKLDKLCPVNFYNAVLNAVHRMRGCKEAGKIPRKGYWGSGYDK